MPHKKPKRPQLQTYWPRDRHTIRLFLSGLATLTLGYICLAQPPVDGLLTQTVAPILLTIGYLILIPLAIIQTIQK